MCLSLRFLQQDCNIYPGQADSRNGGCGMKCYCGGASRNQQSLLVSVFRLCAGAQEFLSREWLVLHVKILWRFPNLSRKTIQCLHLGFRHSHFLGAQ
ncbi:hypothetical protein TNIN_20671 [Trichonephila inaurata madagascariensis]|uniref:Uncharacterized protein n=1 Tax=Trichonephila inaurata madagascariensis TaxID=2747483 RepID=A0A8X6IXE4_9ARAC|nr:hypothetical protein TNIN_20671 [Trichonephila inaurata madagascariensis]